jgi:hypothetical protein
MHFQRELILALAVVVISQWAGQVWLVSHASPRPVDDDNKGIGRALIEMGNQLQRIEAMQTVRMATVNPEANTVTMDQSMLQDTLREIVADELDKVSPALSAEYGNLTPGTAYVGKTTQMAPEQAYAQSAAIIQEAIQYGEWDGERSAQMAPLVNNLSQAQRIELLEQYHGALNRGEIKMTGIVPPL